MGRKLAQSFANLFMGDFEKGSYRKTLDNSLEATLYCNPKKHSQLLIALVGTPLTFTQLLRGIGLPFSHASRSEILFCSKTASLLKML